MHRNLILFLVIIQQTGHKFCIKSASCFHLHLKCFAHTVCWAQNVTYTHTHTHISINQSIIMYCLFSWVTWHTSSTFWSAQLDGNILKVPNLQPKFHHFWNMNTVQRLGLYPCHYHKRLSEPLIYHWICLHKVKTLFHACSPCSLMPAISLGLQNTPLTHADVCCTKTVFCYRVTELVYNKLTQWYLVVHITSCTVGTPHDQSGN